MPQEYQKNDKLKKELNSLKDMLDLGDMNKTIKNKAAEKRKRNDRNGEVIVVNPAKDDRKEKSIDNEKA